MHSERCHNYSTFYYSTSTACHFDNDFVKICNPLFLGENKDTHLLLYTLHGFPAMSSYLQARNYLTYIFCYNVWHCVIHWCASWWHEKYITFNMTLDRTWHDISKQLYARGLPYVHGFLVGTVVLPKDFIK